MTKAANHRSSQAGLNTFGANPKLEVDGGLGATTEAALKTFQEAASLKADGLTDPVALAVIEQRIAAQG